MITLLLSGVIIAGLVLLLRRRERLGLYALVALLPLERIGSFPAHLGSQTITVRPSQLVGAALIILALRKWRSFLPRTFEWLPGLYLLAGLLSLSSAVSAQRALLVLAYSTFVWLLFLAVRRVGRDTGLGTLERVLWWTALATIAFGLYQFVGDSLGLTPAWTGLKAYYTHQVFGFPRIQSFALEPLYLADLLLIPLGVFAALYLRRSSLRVGALLSLISLIITMTLSRGGYLGGLVVLLVVIAALWSLSGALRLGRSIVVGILFGVLLVSGLTFWQAGHLKRVETFSHQATNIETGASVSERSAWRRLAVQAWRSEPLFGIGIGNFGRWAHLQNHSVPETAIVNNEPLELLAETGLIGLLSIAAFIIAILARSWRAYRSKASELDRIWLIGLSAALIGILVQYQTFSTLYITYIWVALGLLVAVQDRILTPKPASVTIEELPVPSRPRRAKAKRKKK